MSNLCSFSLFLDFPSLYSGFDPGARHIPLPDGSGQVKLKAAGQVDLSKVLFYTLYKQIAKNA